MNPILPSIKRSLRLSLKYTQTLVRGYPFSYARIQKRETHADYSHLWSQFNTPIPQRGSETVRENRIHNLNLAASFIDGLILQPQQIFGFWNRVPSPTIANGFREGPVFVRGKVMTDIGGGLCLIATNLFNMFLEAGCEILERHCHSIDPYGEQRFFTLGQDASVAYGYKDLLIRNQASVPLQLRFEVLRDRGEVQSSLWSLSPHPIQVKIESTILEKLSPPTPQGLPGWRVETLRYIAPKVLTHTDHWQVDYRGVSVYHPCES